MPFSPDDKKSGDEGLNVIVPTAPDLDNVATALFPVFSLKGKFVKHESAEKSDIEIQGLTPSMLPGPSRSPGVEAPQQNKRNRQYAIMFTFLLSFVVIVSAIFIAGGEKSESRSTLIPNVFASSEFEFGETMSTGAPPVTQTIPIPTNRPAAVDVASTQKPTHVGTSAPTIHHTHEHHSPRHTGSPTHVEQNTNVVAHRATSNPTGRPTHRKHHHSDNKPTGRPTHKKHHHADQQSSSTTEKPTHKRHDHSDRKPTGKPTHKRHDHSDRQPSTPTEKPTHNKHNHSDHAPPTLTGKPTHKRHEHDEHTSSELKESHLPSPDTSINNSETLAPTSDTHVHIKPRALATIEKSNPDFKLGGMDQLGIQRDEILSFLHFSLSSIAGDTVAKATLNLYLTAYDDNMSNITVTVDMLPHVGDWSVGSVSWNEPLDSDDLFLVDYLVALPLATESTERLYEVDVTPAIIRAHQWVTFRLSTESSGRLSFASKSLDVTEITPTLNITLAL